MHEGLGETGCTALAAVREESDRFSLLTINWRSRLLCEYGVKVGGRGADVDESGSELRQLELLDPLLSEPVGLMETCDPQLFIIQDKKRLHLCLRDGRVVKESLEVACFFFLLEIDFGLYKESFLFMGGGSFNFLLFFQFF